MNGLKTIFFLLLGCSLSLSQSYLRIIDGTPAKPTQLPYQVGLHSYFSNAEEEPIVCGGTIISKRWILTAAHCLEEPDTVLLKVLVFVGTLDKMNKNERGQLKFVIKKTSTILHKSYDRNTVANDIALIKLPRDLKVNPYVQVAKLPKRNDKNLYVGRSAISSGWGITASQQESDILQYLKVKIISNKQCEQEWNKRLKPGRKLLLDSFICIDSNNGLPCRGDSGGPLVLDDGSKTVVGVVSHGFDEQCQIRVPDIFTRVSSFIDWIEKHTGRLA